MTHLLVWMLATTPIGPPEPAPRAADRASLERWAESEESAQIALIERALPAVISIFPPGSSAGGSGVLISADGEAITNYHVVGTHVALRCGLSDGTLRDAVVVGIDPVGDIALIRLLGRTDFPHLAWADSRRARVGERVYAMGNPLSAATNLVPSVSGGILSGVHRYQPASVGFLEYTDALQTDAAINPGNSGGPLIDASGQILGINGRISLEKRGRVNVGVAYAISAHQIQQFLPSLRAGRIAPHASIQASVRTADDGRVLVDKIDDRSEAYHRGLRPGDELVLFADRPIATPNQFLNVLGTLPAGWDVPLTFRRADQTPTIRVRLAPLERRLEASRPVDATLPPEVAAHYRARAGWANDYFQQQWRERLGGVARQALRELPSGPWVFQGVDGGPVDVTLTPESVSWRTPTTSDTWPRGQWEPIHKDDDRILAVAVDLIASLADTAMEWDYLGQFPSAAGELEHVLTWTSSAGVARFLFGDSGDALVGIEWQPANHPERMTLRWLPADGSDGAPNPWKSPWHWESTTGRSGTWQLDRPREARP